MTHPRQRRQFLIAVLAVAVVVFAALAHGAAGDRYDPHGESTAPAERASVMRRASELATQAMSYDSASSAIGVAKVEQYMTAEMRVEYERTLPSPAARKKQAGTGAKVVAKVGRVGIISLTENEASVLVFVNQQASAKSTKKILESPTWEILHLVQQESASSGGDWLLSGMEAP